MSNFIASLDENFEDGGSLHDVVGPSEPGGRKPKPLKSSWHLNERFPAPPRPDVVRYYIDTRGGDTITYADSIELAMECIASLGDPTLVLRPYVVTEDSLRADEEYSRQQRHLGL